MGWMLGKPHSLALSKQQVLEQGVNKTASALSFPGIVLLVFLCPFAYNKTTQYLIKRT